MKTNFLLPLVVCFSISVFAEENCEKAFRSDISNPPEVVNELLEKIEGHLVKCAYKVQQKFRNLEFQDLLQQARLIAAERLVRYDTEADASPLSFLHLGLGNSIVVNELSRWGSMQISPFGSIGAVRKKANLSQVFASEESGDVFEYMGDPQSFERVEQRIDSLDLVNLAKLIESRLQPRDLVILDLTFFFDNLQFIPFRSDLQDEFQNLQDIYALDTTGKYRVLDKYVRYLEDGSIKGPTLRFIGTKILRVQEARVSQLLKAALQKIRPLMRSRFND